MTDHEMRVKLCEAMGWTDLKPVSPCGRMRDLWGTEPAGWCYPVSLPRTNINAPNPLAYDDDAARLRAWCVGRGVSLQIIITTDLGPDSAGVRVRVYKPAPDLSRDYSIAESWVWQQDEPDPLRRERLALCRAVLQALDTVDAGGEA